MIDLDALEHDARNPGPLWEDFAPEPGEVLALVRAVRAAEGLLRHTQYEACLGADGECNGTCETAVGVREALMPFRGPPVEG